ncbi:phage holin family protein [Metabacillus fastidiosus]|uniref:phage holin family protein n=1 Tax=Metabacillus fastidiosus TaxID=1458 RepID=UPI002E226BB5|nr:phage holin family protein [Metabacillus fastidiosus]
MIKWAVSVLVNAVILIVIAGYFDSFHLSGFGAAIIASIILSVLNVLVKPILILLTLPITVVTLGLFLFVINAITLMMTQGIMGESFEIDGFGTAILASVVLSIFHLLIQKGIIEPLNEKRGD